MSSRRRLYSIGAAGVAAMLAALLAMVAADALAWRDAVRQDDVLLQLAPRRAAWAPTALIPFGVGRRLLGVEEDVRLREGLRLFRLARTPDAPQQLRCPPFCRSRGRRGFTPPTVAPPAPAENVEAVRLRARIVLADLERTAPTARDRSLAANLIGVLAYEEARRALLNSNALLEQSTDAFRRALRIHAGNEDAKANLEILLRITGPGGEQELQEAGIFLDETHDPTAGSSRAGRGY